MNDYLDDLSKEELKILIKRNKGDKDRIHYLERELKSRYKLPKNLPNTCKDVLDRMGYTNNLIYKDEASNIILKLPCEISHTCIKEESGVNISYDYISVALITEILDFYHAKYNEEFLLDLYDLDKNIYIIAKMRVNQILINNYWKKE
jgi:hypothetical protein